MPPLGYFSDNAVEPPLVYIGTVFDLLHDGSELALMDRGRKNDTVPTKSLFSYTQPMDRATILALNQINRDFYTQRAEEFSATRRRPWRGWLRLLPYIGERETLSVLDVGCGNGRFAVFLGEHLESPFSYLGIEFSATALEHARAKLSGLPSITLEEHDVMARLDDLTGSFSLITLFGFLHHVAWLRHSALVTHRARPPPRARRDPRFLGLAIRPLRKVSKENSSLGDTFLANTGIEVDRSQLEPGDHILSWGDTEPAYRYCHFTDGDETSRLVSSLPLECFDVFSADGRMNDLNQYFLLKSRPG